MTFISLIFKGFDQGYLLQVIYALGNPAYGLFYCYY
jgi:hypothetical protein